MTYYHYPLVDGQSSSNSVLSSYVWLAIEQLVFTSLIVSNMVFLCIRSFVRHKLQLDLIDEKRQLPNVDTLIAISEVA